MLQRLWKCIHLIAFQLLNHFIYSLYNKCPNWQLSRSVAKSQPTMGDHKKALAGPPAVIWMPDPPPAHFLPPPQPHTHRPPYFYIAVHASPTDSHYGEFLLCAARFDTINPPEMKGERFFRKSNLL